MARILVIDDEPSVRATVAKFLAIDGHQVLQAEDGASAFKIIGGRTPVDLVISDVYMDGMDGMELTARLQQLPSKPLLIIMSGGGHKGVTDLLVEAGHMGAAATLAKPFTRDELLKVVSDLLPPRA